MNWNEFFQLLEKNGLFKPSVDFSFEGDFGDITPYGPTTEIAGFYASPDNFYFDFLSNKKYGNRGQVQITSNSKQNEYTSKKLFIKMVFSNIEVS